MEGTAFWRQAGPQNTFMQEIVLNDPLKERLGDGHRDAENCLAGN